MWECVQCVCVCMPCVYERVYVYGCDMYAKQIQIYIYYGCKRKGRERIKVFSFRELGEKRERKKKKEKKGKMERSEGKA